MTMKMAGVIAWPAGVTGAPAMAWPAGVTGATGIWPQPIELPDELIMSAKEACKLCSIDGCYEPIEGKDRCGKHVNFTGIRGETAR